MYNKADLGYLNRETMIDRDGAWLDVNTNVISKSYVHDEINKVVESLRYKIECLECIVSQTQADLYQIQNDRTLIAETNGSRLYTDGPCVKNLPTDIEDVTLRELLEIISI